MYIKCNPLTQTIEYIDRPTVYNCNVSFTLFSARKNDNLAAAQLENNGNM